MREKVTKNIIWISGRSGYGKTEFAKYIIRKNERKMSKILSGKELVGFLIRNIRAHISNDSIACYFQMYDLLVLDDVDYALIGKPFTQIEVKEIIKKITDNNKTKVILITQKRARKMRKLKFNSNECLYLRFKSPTSESKRKLAEKWLKNIRNVSIGEKEEIINKATNLFQLKGLCNKVSLKHQ